MDNYKIKVKDEAESKEAQELFEQLGFKWAGDYPVNGDWYSHLYAENSNCCYLSPYVWGGLGDRFKELTIVELRVIAKAKQNQDPALISGAEALRALADGKEVEANNNDFGYWIDARNLSVKDFFDDIHIFRLTPQTIKVDLEIPAPFQPKEGEECCYISDESIDGYHTVSYNSERYSGMIFGLYRPSDIEKVVALFRSAFGGAS